MAVIILADHDRKTARRWVKKIRVVTWPYGVKGLYALRNFAILDEKNEYLVKANSYWFLLNTETGRPMRIMESDTAPLRGVQPETRDGGCGKKDPGAEGDGGDGPDGGHETPSRHEPSCKQCPVCGHCERTSSGRDGNFRRSGLNTGKRLCSGMRS